MAFKELIWKWFLTYQNKYKKNSVTAFANYLTKNNRYGTVFSQQIVSAWLNGDFSPSEKYALALADILGDEVFDFLKFPRPDLDLAAINADWSNVPPEIRRSIREQVEQYHVDNQPAEKIRRRSGKNP